MATRSKFLDKTVGLTTLYPLSHYRYGFFSPRDEFDASSGDCGGFTRLWRKNRGQCGICGDPADLERPRPHEDGGKYGQGIVTKTYESGQEIIVRLEIITELPGHLEVRIEFGL